MQRRDGFKIKKCKEEVVLKLRNKKGKKRKGSILR